MGRPGVKARALASVTCRAGSQELIKTEDSIWPPYLTYCLPFMIPDYLSHVDPAVALKTGSFLFFFLLSWERYLVQGQTIMSPNLSILVKGSLHH